MGRAHPCCSSEEKKVRKGLWSPEEDERLASHIARFGVSCWSSIPELAGLQRCGKSCRLRWMNYLRPDLKRGRFSQQEEDLIISLHKALGNSWSQIAARLPGRSDNEIKNFWNARLRKKLRQKEASSTTGSKEPAASQRRRGGVDERTQPAVAFNPFHAREDQPRPAAGYVVVAGPAAGTSCGNDDSPAAAGSSFVVDAAAATSGGGNAVDAGRNAAAAESVTPSPASTTSACTEARGCEDDDGFLRAMVDDASFLFGDFFVDGNNHDGSAAISFWERHAFS